MLMPCGEVHKDRTSVVTVFMYSYKQGNTFFHTHTLLCLYYYLFPGLLWCLLLPLVFFISVSLTVTLLLLLYHRVFLLPTFIRFSCSLETVTLDSSSSGLICVSFSSIPFSPSSRSSTDPFNSSLVNARLVCIFRCRSICKLPDFIWAGLGW